MGELMGGDKKYKSKKCRKSSGKDAKRSRGDDACEVTKDRVRAHFLDGNTGPWAKNLAAEDVKNTRAAAQATTQSVEDSSAQRAEAAASAAHERAASGTPTRRGPDYSVPSSIDLVADPVLHALSTRRSISKVDPETPNDSDLLELIRSVSSVADHKGLRPWRFLIIRGDDRHRLGEALDEAAGVSRKPGEVNEKPLRAELLLALVASAQKHDKVPEWEQHATAAGAGHLLELALWQAGWGVMWRSGTLTNSEPVRRLHRLKENELLMGWFYIGAVPERYRQRLTTSTRPLPAPEQFLDTL
ncbi:nitroreductase family protein [Brevibacterium spongiae]|uniref:Nitroreductase family protein n=1 Tax=Brevibacterium spongiae TaxID=2909672 RepID=A0ABY5SRC9_9MICO|nr:nitroreductase family protein [Brevibacterium spongiae]UVI37057.1 nitroreductase family protein [Brevibacterium spongiae]